MVSAVYLSSDVSHNIIPGGFCCLPGGKFTPRPQPRKFCKFKIFPNTLSSPHRCTGGTVPKYFKTFTRAKLTRLFR